MLEIEYRQSTEIILTGRASTVVGGTVAARCARATGGNASDSGVDFIGGSIVHDQVLREDATFRVVGIIAGVALARVIVNIARGKGTGEQGILRVTTNGGDLLGKLENDGLINGGSVVRGRILESDKVSDLNTNAISNQNLSPGVAG
jgi:hypothetical protein